MTTLLLFLWLITPTPTVTVLVVNDSYHNIVVYADNARIATVLPHQSECVIIRNPTYAKLHIRATGDPQIYEAPFTQLDSYLGWEWRLDNNLRISVINLSPTEIPCRR